MSRSQEPQAKALQMGVKRLPFRNTVGALTPTSKMTCSSCRTTVQLAKTLPGIAVAEVIRPAFQPTVDVVNHLADGDEIPLGPVSSRSLSRARAIAFAEGNTLR